MGLFALRLKKYEERRLLQGHLWVYSNEVDTHQTPFSRFSPGQLVSIEDYRGYSLGVGYINPHTLLCARLLTRDPYQAINEDFFIQRIERALQLREALFTKPFYRLIYGESDGLPGLIVDRYDDLLVAQLTTAGMDALKDLTLAGLQQVVQPASILWRNDHSMRLLEGLPQTVAAAWGNPPETVQIEENEAIFTISPWEGQKTGWFYDHRENRRQLARYVQNRRVLDVFCYTGAWAIQAARHGARDVWALDSSAVALHNLAKNATLNGQNITVFQADAFEQMKQWVGEKMQFDVIILDPPAFIKKRKDHAQGLAAYKRLNTLAIQLLAENGYLITASCSHHLSAEELRESVLAAATSCQRNLQILARGHQGLDHPVHPAIVETDYLKTLFCRV